MNQEFEIRDIPLSSPYFKKKAESFLAARSLRMADLDYMAGIYDSDDTLCGCGGTDRQTIKCVALSPDVRNCNLSGRLITHLCNRIMDEGYDNVKVFTKPENSAIFQNLGFSIIGSGKLAVLLEKNPFKFEQYIKYLSTLRKDGNNGVIVMNANPFTLGHLHLITEASRRVDNLYIIPLSDNPHTEFSYKERRQMIIDATAGIKNAVVAEGSDYAISADTFPTYFIKEITEATEAHIDLDLTIFKEKIAPALGITHRFAGSEPTDRLTALYNRRMAETLPSAGIEFTEIPRLEDNNSNTCISASAVRKYIASGESWKSFQLVPATTLPYIISHTALKSLQMELDLTPKPGLVDKNDSGAHKDMDHALMSKSIDSLRPFFDKVALTSTVGLPASEQLSALGIEAEKEMFCATGGVNTHKGALFSLGLATAAASYLATTKGAIDIPSFRETISSLASGFKQPDSTHGALVKRLYDVPGALDNARNGYAMLFDEWLPFLRIYSHESFGIHRLLLKIICGLQDSNILFRIGRDGAYEAQVMACHTLRDFSLEKLQSLNSEFIARNISPGGAADMLALTLFVGSIIKP